MRRKAVHLRTTSDQERLDQLLESTKLPLKGRNAKLPLTTALEDYPKCTITISWCKYAESQPGSHPIRKERLP